MMYFIVYNLMEEKICQDIDEVAQRLVEGWKLYGFAYSEKQAGYLLNECQHC